MELRDYQEALKFVELNTEKEADSVYHRGRVETLEAIEDLVEYRTPTEVIKEIFDFSDGGSYTYIKCPRCKEMIVGKPHYCENCGQAIDGDSYENH